MYSSVEIELSCIIAVIVHPSKADGQITQGLIGSIVGNGCQELRDISRAVLEYPIAYARQVLVDRLPGVASGVSLE